MAQYKKGGWGSVSTNFNPVTGFTSDANRMQQRSKDRYDKQVDQIRSEKEVLNLQTQQMSAAARMDQQTANYELKALSNFSKTLNTFLSTTVKEEAARRKEADIRKYMDIHRRKQDDYFDQKNDLQRQLSAAEKAKGDTAAIQAKLDELERKGELDRSRELEGLSGNEKFAYYAVKAEQIVRNAPIGLQNYYQTNGEDWIPTYDGKGEIQIKDVTDPRDRQTVARRYQTKILEETDMGGLKTKYQVALLHGPLDDKIQNQLVNDVKNYNIDVARERLKASNQTLSNILRGINDGKNAPTMESWIQNVYPQYRRDMDIIGDGTIVWDKIAADMKGILKNTETNADAEKVYNNILKMTSTINVKTPAGDKPLSEHYKNRFDKDIFTKEYVAHSTYLSTAKKGKVQTLLTGDISAERDKILQKVAEDDSYTYDMGVADFHEFLDQQGEYDPLGHKAEIIQQFRGDTRLGRTSEAWLGEARGIGMENNNEIKHSDIAGMPKALKEQLEEEDFIFVDHYTGGKTDVQINKTKNDQAQLMSLLKSIENDNMDKGGMGDPAKSAAVRDMAKDMYIVKTRHFMSEAGGGYNHSQASTMARQEIESEIRGGAGNNPESPFAWQQSPQGVWSKNTAITEHMSADIGYSTYRKDNVTLNIQHIDRNRRLLEGKGPLDNVARSKEWMFLPIDIEDESSYDFLFPEDDGSPNRFIVFQAKRLGLPPRVLLERQLAALAEKHGTDNPVYTLIYNKWYSQGGTE